MQTKFSACDWRVKCQLKFIGNNKTGNVIGFYSLGNREVWLCPTPEITGPMKHLSGADAGVDSLERRSKNPWRGEDCQYGQEFTLSTCQQERGSIR